MSAEVTVPIKPYLILLAWLVVIFVFVHLVLNVYHYEVEEVPWLLLQLFELDEENNLPTWFSSYLLLNNAAVLFLAGIQATKHRGQWLILAAGFLMLSIDEVAGLHETFHTAIDTNWTLYAAVIVGFVGLAFVPFLLALPRRLATMFVLSGMLYVSGALLVEWLSQDMDEENLHYAVAVLVEEGLEMIGALCFLAVNLYRLRALNPTSLLILR
ncbi:MAG: hypothetical protein ACJAYE_002757 [Candidatus Azotimanducaceae bacterium]|jgi:hypothetical protein